MNDPAYRTAVECLKLLGARAISSLELVDHCIARIESLDAQFNAVVARDFGRAREKARAADEARAAGNDIGPLHGLPVTIKDSFQTAGLVTTSGAPELRDYVPAENAVAVQRLVDAGAIILGKTNVPIHAGDWQTYNQVYGRTNNPWDVSRTVGGSSGGSAAALAAGFVPLELGSDIAGSIRMPASFCGVYGHKPSHGIVPGRGHIPGPPGTLKEPDLSVVGPLARDAGDLGLALSVLAGPDVLAQSGWKLELPQPRADRLADFRVGFWMDDSLCPIDATVRTELEATVETLRSHVELIDVGSVLRLDAIAPLYIRLLMGMAGENAPRPLQLAGHVLRPCYTVAAHLGLRTDVIIEAAVRSVNLSHADWSRANEERARLRWRCHDLFRDIDVLLTPVGPVAAFAHQTQGNHLSRKITVDGTKYPYTNLMPWIALANTAYLPATSAPIGMTPDGLPIGIQIIGPYLGDETTIRFAELLADIKGGFHAPRAVQRY